MATKLHRGMGTFFKECSCTRKSRCPHPYTIRFRDASGRQREEHGYAAQQDAVDRLTTIYNEKRTTPKQKAEQQREVGKQRFGQYASAWLARQRHYTLGSQRAAENLLKNHILPHVESRRINTFNSTVVENFIASLEESGVGLATQQNSFDTLRKILIDAKRKGGIAEDPFEGVIPPEYIPRPVTIPTLEEIHTLKAAADDELRLIIDLMSGCGMRNGEAYAANIERLVADDVYRISEQIDGITRAPSRLKHRKPGEFREVPMPATVRDSILTYEKDHGCTSDGYLLRTQRSVHWGHSTLNYHWGKLKKKVGINRKLTPYALRHYFASNCLSRNIPITDVAEWMGHSDIRITFRIYRHLMPASIGRAAKVLNDGL